MAALANVCPGNAAAAQCAREIRRHDGACWAFDISDARDLIDAASAGDRPQGWSKALLSRLRVVDANANAIVPVAVELQNTRCLVSRFWISGPWKDGMSCQG